MIESNVDLVRGWAEALGSGQVDAVRAAMAEDASWFVLGELPQSGNHRGIDAIFSEFLAHTAQLWAPGSPAIEVTDVFEAGERVVLEWRETGRTSRGGEFGGPSLLLITVREGKISEIRHYFDTDGARRHLME